MKQKKTTKEKAQEVFSLLSPETQLFIKNNSPEVYKSLFDVRSEPDNTVLEDFIIQYQPEDNGQDKALLVFSNLPIGTQASIKNTKPDMYNAIVDTNSTKKHLINEFLEEYEPLNEKVKNFEDFKKLSIEKQLLFKNNFPESYSKIISTEPK